MYDRACVVCDEKLIDCYEPITAPAIQCKCGAITQRVMLPGSANSVIGDEIDVSIRNGLCDSNGNPTRFRSREALKRAEKKAGLTNYVVHRGSPGSDKSKHTRPWF